MLPSYRLMQNGCILGRCVEWVQVCRSGRSKHFGAATPGHRVAVEVSMQMQHNYEHLLFVWLYFPRFNMSFYSKHTRVYELRLNIKSFHKYL